ncbi:unnamed protein product [Polarella glacialis]|uniref:Armadillo repeat-containing protein 8 n=1 Tax=Polarella glacialis TaxID=89957 RepID=A0A813EE65_POLGL|nr:unnamed protein product [Polarella glacialis]
MKDKDCHIIEVAVLNQSLSEELDRVRVELAERDARDRSLRNLLRKEVDEMRQMHQSSQQEMSELRSQLVQCQRLNQEFERVKAELIERDERDKLLRKEVDELRQQQKCSQQEVSELRSQLTSAETSCKQLSSEFALAQDAASSLNGELSSSSSLIAEARSQLCTSAVSDDPGTLALEADSSAKAPSRALEEINEEGGDDSNHVLSNHTVQADTPEQNLHEQQQQQEAAASQNGQSALTSCSSEVGLLSEPSQILAGFRFGQYSVINNLWSRPELTCMVGRLLEFDQNSGRWRLLLENGEYIRVKPEFMTHYDVPRGVRRKLFQFNGPAAGDIQVTSRLKISFLLKTFPPLCDAERLAEHIGALGHEVFGNGAAQRELEHMGGLTNLVNSLVSASNTVQELAAVALGFVGRDLIIGSGAVPQLVALLFECSCSKVQKEAAETLARLCGNAPDRRQHVFEEIEPDRLVLLLHFGGAKSQSVQGGAALLCGELAKGCPPIREALVKAGVVPHIVTLLQLAPSTARHGAFALSYLLFPACEDIRRSIVEANAIPSLVGLLKSEFFHARHMALRAIKCLALGSPSNQLAIATVGTGVLTVMAKLMRTPAGAADVLFQVMSRTATIYHVLCRRQDPGLLQSTMCCVEDNGFAGYYMKGVTLPQQRYVYGVLKTLYPGYGGPSVVYILHVLMVRAQLSEQSAAIQLATDILRSGGLESKTLVCNMFLRLLAIDVSSKFDFKGQITRAGAVPCLQRMLVQHKLPATSVAARLAQIALTHLDNSPESV